MKAIAAIDKKRGIAKNGSIPWDRPVDQKWFRGITWGHPLIMGRRTLETSPAPFEGRENLVLTHRPDSLPPGVKAVDENELPPNSVVIGGLETYKYFWDDINTWFWTLIQEDYECDLTLPRLDQSRWNVTKIRSYDDIDMYQGVRK